MNYSKSVNDYLMLGNKAKTHAEEAPKDEGSPTE